MRGEAIAPALLFTALGLALVSTPRGVWMPGLMTLVTSVAAFSFVAVPQTWLEAVYLGCWASVVATAANVQFSRAPGLWIVLGLSLNAGFWASAVGCLSASPVDALKALPCVLILFPSRWVARRYSSIPVRVVSSWIIAVAVLAATLQVLPVTPGYLPDHLE
jgi:hypothetical protein